MKLKIFTSTETLSLAVEDAKRVTKEMYEQGYEAVNLEMSEKSDFLGGGYKYVLKIKYDLTENPTLYQIDFVENCESYQEAIEKLEEISCNRGYEAICICDCTSIFEGTVVSGVVLINP